MHDRLMTRTPFALGIAGLIPFAFLAVLMVTGWYGEVGWTHAVTRLALLGYGAVIASFLGGIRWGLAIHETGREAARDFGLSVIPSLVAWVALMIPGVAAFWLIGALLLALGWLDQDLVRRGVAPAWFGRLRLMLSLGAGLSLLTAAFG